MEDIKSKLKAERVKKYTWNEFRMTINPHRVNVLFGCKLEPQSLAHFNCKSALTAAEFYKEKESDHI